MSHHDQNHDHHSVLVSTLVLSSYLSISNLKTLIFLLCVPKYHKTKALKKNQVCLFIFLRLTASCDQFVLCVCVITWQSIHFNGLNFTCLRLFCVKLQPPLLRFSLPAKINERFIYQLSFVTDLTKVALTISFNATGFILHKQWI